jgi:hypothetical protein
MYFLIGGMVMVVAFVVSRLSRRGHAADLGRMSGQWLAEQRTTPPL